MDRVTLLRSLTHPWNFHGMQYATTGLPQGTIPIEETQQHPEQWPFLGSVVSYLDRKTHGPKPKGGVPDNVVLPWLLSSKRTMPPYARPHAAYLGGEFDPIWGEFRGTADPGGHPQRLGAGRGVPRPAPRHHPGEPLRDRRRDRARPTA